MLFEDINILINKITILLENKNNYKSINFSEFNNIKYEIYNNIIKEYKVSFELIDEIINLLYKKNFIYDKNDHSDFFYSYDNQFVTKLNIFINMINSNIAFF